MNIKLMNNKKVKKTIFKSFGSWDIGDLYFADFSGSYVSVRHIFYQWGSKLFSTE